MLKPYNHDILIDAQNGRVEGAALREKMALVMLRMAMRVLSPFHLFGFSYVARAVRKLFPSKRPMTFALAPDCRMRVTYCDAYWSILLLPAYPYEPAIRSLLTASRDVAYGFIDGGANHGFWSILVSGPEAGSKKAVAVEAASDTFEHLEDNRQLNDDRFAALNKAVGARSGERVRIYGAKHEARSTVAPGDGAKPILDCETITVDDIAALPHFAGLEKFIVKLDVEGVEIAAFSGATRLLEGDTVFIYEEHGSDPDHEATRHVLEVLKLRVFWLGEGLLKEITSPKDIGRIKKSRRFGYDMIASCSPFWIERLEKFAAETEAVN